MIAGLIEKGYAYPAGGDVYFDVARTTDYGKLCNRDPEQLEAGPRIEVSDRKRNPGDFALWKGAKPGEPAVGQPVGPGPAGLAHRVLGMSDEAARRDARHPRRRARPAVPAPRERAGPERESRTGKPFARVWMHNGLLKMRQRQDGRVGRERAERGRRPRSTCPGEVLRFFILSTHYRSPIDLGDWDPASGPIPSGLEAAQRPSRRSSGSPSGASG